MRFYRHYKNKDYTYKGIAKHSETHEDMVVYECRYNNPTAKLWVRPKSMFFGKVKIDGELQPRFAKVRIQIRSFRKASKKDIAEIAPIIEAAFGEWDSKWFHGAMKGKSNFFWQIAYVDKQAVGFKAGYQSKPKVFYSWMGGVLPKYQGLGIAQKLMQEQHEWCKKQGYKKIKTETMNRFKEMLILNVRSGFDIVGSHVSKSHKGLKIELEKKL
jgi:ribosomal protein S18 acetylase RimI-like enzyme